MIVQLGCVALTQLEQRAVDTAALSAFKIDEEHNMIDKLQSLSGRALDLVGQAGDGLRHMVPNGAGKLLETGAALGALKTGSRVATTLVRRHPAAAVATVAGAGLLWYLARRRARQAEHAPIEGSATRIEARRSTAKPRTRSTAKRSTRRSTTQSTTTGRSGGAHGRARRRMPRCCRQARRARSRSPLPAIR